MDEELVERLRTLMGRVPADATAAPLGRPMPQPTIGPVSPGTPPSPRPARGLMAAIARSAQAGGGLANELLNPVRAGASARQMVNEAIPAARQGNIGRAAGLGALAAMSVPGVPGPSAKPRALTGVAMRRKSDGRVFAIDGFDGGHDAVWSIARQDNPYTSRDISFVDGFIDSNGNFVNRAEALRIAREAHQWSGLNRARPEPSGEMGLMSEAINRPKPR